MLCKVFLSAPGIVHRFIDFNKGVQDLCQTDLYKKYKKNGVPRAQKKKTKRAAGSPAALAQLALCLRLAFDL